MAKELIIITIKYGSITITATIRKDPRAPGFPGAAKVTTTAKTATGTGLGLNATNGTNGTKLNCIVRPIVNTTLLNGTLNATNATTTTGTAKVTTTVTTTATTTATTTGNKTGNGTANGTNTSLPYCDLVKKKDDKSGWDTFWVIMAWLVGLGVIGAITFVILTAKPGPGVDGPVDMILDVAQPAFDDDLGDGGMPILSNKV